MKKLITFILLFGMLISCVACDNNDISSSIESETKEQVSSKTEETVDAVESSELDCESEAESDVSGIESEEQASSQEQESESTEAETESDTDAVAPLTEYGQFSSAISETAQAYDRLRQMASSASTYGNGATCSESELDSILSSANAIKNGGAILNYKNASAFMKHFLDNTGEDYTIDVSDFLTDENALKTRNEELNKALRACEALAVEDETVNVFQKEELVHHNLTGDWKYAIGSYFTSIEVKNLSVNGNIYSATIIYKVTDFYNWDYSDDNPVFSGLPAMIVGDVSPKDLHELHREGVAREFLSYGEISYKISWFKGSSVETIPALSD